MSLMDYHITIQHYKESFPEEEVDRGKQYHIEKVERQGQGIYRLTVNQKYESNTYVRVRVQKNGDIDHLESSCMCRSIYCRHVIAALDYLSDVYMGNRSTQSSRFISQLIMTYGRQLSDQVQQPVRIEPEVSLNEQKGSLFLRLRIGRTKMYLLPDIGRFMDACEYHHTKSYGKELEWTHDLSALDSKSRRLAELAYDIYQRSRGDYRNYTWNSGKEFSLQDASLERFMDIMGEDTLTIGKTVYTVVPKDPALRASLRSVDRSKLCFTVENPLLFLGSAERGYFLSQEEQKLYVTSRDYANALSPLLKVLAEHEKLMIAQKDVSAFFSTVLRQIEPYCDTDMTAVDESQLPPQLVSQLYVDVDEQGVVCATLQFSYGERFYSAFAPPTNRLHEDHYGETAAKQAVLHYFTFDSADKTHPLKATDDDTVFLLISEGMTKLSRFMEVYVSDRFKGISVRKPVQTSVGIRPTGDLLELDISSVGYTLEELTEMLNAYRKGRKYHRFRDGSFSMVDDSMKELDMLTKELNISDKALLKEKVTVPMYRMLYLNSLQTDGEAIRLKRSSDFKQYAKDYENSLRDEERLVVPQELESILRDYQKDGFRWMKTLHLYHMGGILADDMGLGKTLQAIALMLNEKNTSADGEHKQFLVVCPSSLTLNWLNEIAKFAPQLKALCVTGTVAERNKLFETMGDYDVLITSYATLLRDIERYEDRHFAVQFLDEAQNIKNHTTRSAKAVKVIHSDRRFALTGTPVENSLAELWSIFDFIMPGYLHNYTYFQRNYETPIVKKNDAAAVRSLQRMTSPFILRRLKKEVLTELPDKTETVLVSDMDETQRKLYLANAIQAKRELAGMDGQRDKLKMLTILLRLRQICCDPSLVYENYDGGQAKLEQCMELIENCIEAGHKILLFSQFTSMLTIIATALTQRKRSFYMLTGETKTKERLRMVNDFNQNEVNVFLISLKAGGTGLNLTGADIVIHYDPWWNLSAENQASDRVYRIGQKNSVQIYKLIVKDTVEEKICQLQQRKAELLETAVGGEGDILNMTTDEIISLL